MLAKIIDEQQPDSGSLSNKRSECVIFASSAKKDGNKHLRHLLLALL
jgi:hypothetical protein